MQPLLTRLTPVAWIALLVESPYDTVPVKRLVLISELGSKVSSQGDAASSIASYSMLLLGSEDTTACRELDLRIHLQLWCGWEDAVVEPL